RVNSGQGFSTDDKDFLYHLGYFVICVLGTFVHPFFYSILLLDVVHREETLLNVIKSVTRNGRSIVLTAVLALILVYLFSIIGYLWFKDDFLVTVEPEDTESAALAIDPGGFCSAGSPCSNDTVNVWVKPKENVTIESTTRAVATSEDVKERACDSLIMCIVTTLNQGLRNGGGIGDVLRSPSAKERLFFARVFYDLLFFFVVIIIVLNLIFGVIIDTFADLRSEKQQKEEILKNTCFVCGLERSAFDNRVTSFEDHIRKEHNMWHYLYFIVLVRVKDSTEFTGPESYVHAMVKEKNLDWFPRLRSMSLITSNETFESLGTAVGSDLSEGFGMISGSGSSVGGLSTQLSSGSIVRSIAGLSFQKKLLTFVFSAVFLLQRERLFFARVFYDLLFFFVVIIIVLNLIFGVIIDTFADLRSEKQQKEEILKNTCFVCGLERSAFDNRVTSFEDHIRKEHNMWHYLYFIVLVRVKDSTEFTGPESYVHAMVKEKNLDWFPRLRSMSLITSNETFESLGTAVGSDLSEGFGMISGSGSSVGGLSTQLSSGSIVGAQVGTVNSSHVTGMDIVKNLSAQLESTQKLVLGLSRQLQELKDQGRQFMAWKILAQFVLRLSSPSAPFAIRRIEELNKSANGSVEAKVLCFFRRRDIPPPLLILADKHDTGIVAKPVDENGEEEKASVVSEDDDGLTVEQRHHVKHRELFLSRQVETLPASQIRGKCYVTLLNETESYASYLNKEDTFFYSLVYDPQQKTLLADRGEIRVGLKYQADPVTLSVKPNGVSEKNSENLEELLWDPENHLCKEEIEEFLVLAKSVGTFARAVDSSGTVKTGTLQAGAAAACRDATSLYAMKLLHKCNYDWAKSVRALVPSGSQGTGFVAFPKPEKRKDGSLIYDEVPSRTSRPSTPQMSSGLFDASSRGTKRKAGAYEQPLMGADYSSKRLAPVPAVPGTGLTLQK
ncbi:unnamed protein product, partial [Notodromas monacha]